MDRPDPLRLGVVRVLKSDDTTAGTGFLTHGNLIVTCAHVVDGGSLNMPPGLVQVEFSTGERVRARIDATTWRHGGVDLAVLAPDEGHEQRHPLQLGTSHEVEGKNLRTFGFPFLNPVEGLAAECHIVRGQTKLHGVPVFALRSHEVTRGFSGAPVWDDDMGAVVGIITSFVASRLVPVGNQKLPMPGDPHGRQTETAYMIGADLVRESCPTLSLPDGAPYRRLDFFGPEHVDFYFGRERATDKLLRKLMERDFVVLVGTSGSGKSSLVRAGLEKGLRHNRIPGLAERNRLLLTPGTNPLMDLTLALSGFPGRTNQQVAERLGVEIEAFADDPGARERANAALSRMSPRELADAVRTLAPPQGGLLIVDQFERVFTECHDDGSRTTFIDALLATANDTLKLLVVLRADFYGRAMRHLDLSKAVEHGQVTILPMDENEIRSAIEEPARVLLRRFQPSLVTALVSDVSGQAGALPLLEFTLAELWTKNAGRAVITHDSYNDLSYSMPGSGGIRLRGVNGAIAQAAEKVWQTLDPQEREIVPRVFRALVTHEGPDDDQGGHVARYVSRRTWQAEWDEVTRAVAERFVAARLLVTRTDAVSHQPVFELAHEALTEAWPALRKWLAESNRFGRWYARDLAPAFRDWIGRDRHPEYLLRESMLSPAQGWLRDYPEGLSAPLREYIALSVAASERRQAEERARNDELERALRDEQNQRQLAQQRTEETNCLLWATRARQDMDDSVAVALALAANRGTSPPAFAQQVLAEVAYRPGPRREFTFGHRGPVWCLAWQGDVAVSGSEDGSLLVWDLTGQRLPRRLAGHTGNVWTVVLSTDGNTMLSGADDRRLIVWDVTTGRILRRLDGHEGAVRAVALAGNIAVSGSYDRQIIVWDIGTGRAIRTMNSHRDVITSVALAGDVAVSGSADRTVIVWDVATGTPRQRLAGHTGSVWSVAISEDQQTVISGSSDRTVIVWDVATGTPRQRLARHTGAVMGVVPDATAAQVLSCADDRSVIVWDTAAGEPVRYLRGHGTAITGVALSADGRIALSGAEDGTTIVWDTTTGHPVRHLRGHGTAITGVALSADGRIALSGAEDGTTIVWDTTTGHPVRHLRGHGTAITGVALNADGRIALSGAEDGTTIVWDTTTGHPNLHLDVGIPAVTDVALAANGHAALVSGADGALTLADVATGRRLAWMHCRTAVSGVALDVDGGTALAVMADGALVQLQSRTVGAVDLGEPLGLGDTAARCAALSGDARNLVVGGSDGGLTLWDSATGTAHRLSGHKATVRAVALSADGTTVLSSGDDQRLFAWNTTRSTLLQRITAHAAPVTGIALSRDGRTALSGSDDSRIVLWNLATGEPMREWAMYGANGVALNGDGTLAVAAFDILSLLCWDTRSAGPPRQLSGHTEAVTCVAVSTDGHTAVSGAVDQRVLLWNTAACELVRGLHGHTGSVRSVALGADGHSAVSGSDDRSVIVWDTDTGAIIRRLEGHRDAVTCVAFSPSGRTVASGSADGAIFCWDLDTNTRNAYVSHQAAITGLSFSVDGTTLLSSASDGTVIVWDVAIHQPVRFIATPGMGVRCLSSGVDRDGPVVVVGRSDGAIMVWRVHSHRELVAWTHARRLVRELSCEERETHHLSPLCDEHGNVPENGPPPVPPETVTSLTLGPAPAFPPPPVPTDLPLEPGTSHFDAVQEGRTRTWRFDGRRGQWITILVTPEGIDLEPNLELHGPGRPIVGVSDDQVTRRAQVGPLELPATGTYQVVVSGRGTSAGGYTITRDAETG